MRAMARLVCLVCLALERMTLVTLGHLTLASLSPPPCFTVGDHENAGPRAQQWPDEQQWPHDSNDRLQ